MIKNFLWNGAEHRLRAFWRILLQLVLFAVLLIPAGSVATIVAISTVISQEGMPLNGFGPDNVITELMGNPTASAVFTLGVAAAAVASIWIAGRVVDRRRFIDFGFHLTKSWWADLGFGLALGAGLMTVIFLVEWDAGWITITGTRQTPVPQAGFGLAMAAQFFSFVCVGIYEEMLFRGYHLKNLAEGLAGLGKRGALVLSVLAAALVFALAHAGNPHATALSTLSIFLAGVFLALGYVLTGELAIPIGVHITWNFFQGNILGFPVSGSSANTTTFIAVEQGGPPVITGGAFGPEAGLIGVAALVLGSALVLAWVRIRRGQVRLAERLATPTLREPLL